MTCQRVQPAAGGRCLGVLAGGRGASPGGRLCALFCGEVSSPAEADRAPRKQLFQLSQAVLVVTLTQDSPRLARR